jgi:Uma2 family endonuclease
MRILIARTGLYTYPDVVVVCGERQLQKDNVDTLLNPTVLFEGLSPTTEASDRGRKSAHYRRMESLREYVLVAQDEVHVERYTRQGDDWLLTEMSDIQDNLQLTSIGCTVALREIYARVEFPEAGPG